MSLIGFYSLFFCLFVVFDSIDAGSLPYNLVQGKCVQYDNLPPKGTLQPHCQWRDALHPYVDYEVLKGKIAAYKIKWFNGSWSGWFVPGVNDIDQGKPQNPQLYLTENDETGRAIQSIGPSAITCSEGKLEPDPLLYKLVENCSNPQIYGNEEGKMNPNCSNFCQAKTLGLLNEQGLPTKELYDNFIEKNVQKPYRKKMEDYMSSCFEKYGKLVDVEDQDCVGGAMFFGCTWEFNQLDC